jgi:hypothetical protein
MSAIPTHRKPWILAQKQCRSPTPQIKTLVTATWIIVMFITILLIRGIPAIHPVFRRRDGHGTCTVSAYTGTS